MKKYDYIITGAGLAGLSLAFYLNQSENLRNKRILIIDKNQKNEDDRTWCFWSDEKTAFDEIVARDWQDIHFYGTDYHERIDLSPFKYKMIHGIDFYNFTKNALHQNKNIDWVHGNVDVINDLEKGGSVVVENVEYQGDWIFNSIFNIDDFKKESGKYFHQLQHFKGWIIETEEDTFQPEQMNLMDFRTEQHNNARFFYLLPYNKRKALVEYTIFSDTLLEQEDYDFYLKEYITETLGIPNYKIEETEYGVIPMTNQPFEKAAGKHILNIGTIGGDVKSSTGYAFHNIQEVARKVVLNLEEKNQPFYNINLFDKRFAIYDTLILNILQREGGLIKPIFTQLFKKNHIHTVFNFLNEKTTLLQELKLFFSLPHTPFWKGIFQVYFYQTIRNLFKR
ncbi:MAG: lycopene beta-cyclase [Cognaticolwellia sp.]|jgi:lycopene beta-cyclase